MELGSAASQAVPVATRESVTQRVIRDASRAYGDTIAEETLADLATSAVAELWGESVKVTTFLPLLAMRKIELEVAQLNGTDTKERQ